MFQFPGFALTNVSSGPSAHWVSPFGHARINPCLQVPEPFRSLPRPSSPPDSLGIHRSLFVSFLIALHPLPPMSHDTEASGAECESFLICSCLEIAVPNFYNFRKNLYTLTDSLSVFLYLLIFSLSIVNELSSVTAGCAVVCKKD